MLRSWTIAVGAVAFLLGIIALLAGIRPGFVIAFWGAVAVLSVVYERFRYKALETAAPEPGWTKTAERFIDEETGQPVTVWLDPGTGERKYVRG
ncbi:MAG TPA: hypothetical protein VL286_08980 [Rhizomicrobium sp.]|jgi:hypothetical protein|nr:hypothetical protein [Rhizomicrobium sp.]